MENLQSFKSEKQLDFTEPRHGQLMLDQPSGFDWTLAALFFVLNDVFEKVIFKTKKSYLILKMNHI